MVAPRLGVGLCLQPEARYLTLARRSIEELADFYEITPESLWDRGLAAHPARAPLLEIVRRSGRPCVAHGTSLSLGGCDAAGEPERVDGWLRRMQAEQQDFDFRWYSDHLGFISAGAAHVALPLPLLMTDEVVAGVAARLRRMKSVTPVVAFENSAFLFALGDPRREPEFLNAIAAAADAWLLLDLHNAWTHQLNLGVDLDRWLAALDLTRVLEIHLSGGSMSDPKWLKSGRTFRLDSHDGAVPDPVWHAYEQVVPRCPNLRAVVIERVAEGFDPCGAALLEREIERARRSLC